MSSNHKTIGISGPSGGGKTTVTKALAGRMVDSVSLFFDEYDDLTIAPHSFEAWLTGDPDFNAWRCSRLVSDLEALRRGKTIKHPVSGANVDSAGTILFDAPLGYANESLGKLIDFMIYIDTPLDIAMARRLLRETTLNTSTDLATEMENYLKFGRKCYLAMDRHIKPTCDLVVDGSHTIEGVVDEILAVIEPETNRK